MLNESSVIRVTLENDFVVHNSGSDAEPTERDREYARKLSDVAFDDQLLKFLKYFKSPRFEKGLISEDLVASKKRRSGHVIWHLVSKLRIEITEDSNG